MRSRKRKDKMKLSLPPKLVEKLVWVPVVLLCKIFFIPRYAFDALLCLNWPFSRPNRETLWITLMRQTQMNHWRRRPESSCHSVCLEFEHEVNLVFNLVSTSERRYTTQQIQESPLQLLYLDTNLCINPTIVQCTLEHLHWL
jgi:hypothetical protein